MIIIIKQKLENLENIKRTSDLIMCGTIPVAQVNIKYYKITYQYF